MTLSKEPQAVNSVPKNGNVGAQSIVKATAILTSPSSEKDHHQPELNYFESPVDDSNHSEEMDFGFSQSDDDERTFLEFSDIDDRTLFEGSAPDGSPVSAGPRIVSVNPMYEDSLLATASVPQALVTPPSIPSPSVISIPSPKLTSQPNRVTSQSDSSEDLLELDDDDAVLEPSLIVPLPKAASKDSLTSSSEWQSVLPAPPLPSPIPTPKPNLSGAASSPFASPALSSRGQLTDKATVAAPYKDPDSTKHLAVDNERSAPAIPPAINVSPLPLVKENPTPAEPASVSQVQVPSPQPHVAQTPAPPSSKPPRVAPVSPSGPIPIDQVPKVDSMPLDLQGPPIQRANSVDPIQPTTSPQPTHSNQPNAIQQNISHGNPNRKQVSKAKNKKSKLPKILILLTLLVLGGVLGTYLKVFSGTPELTEITVNAKSKVTVLYRDKMIGQTPFTHVFAEPLSIEEKLNLKVVDPIFAALNLPITGPKLNIYADIRKRRRSKSSSRMNSVLIISNVPQATVKLKKRTLGTTPLVYIAEEGKKVTLDVEYEGKKRREKVTIGNRFEVNIKFSIKTNK